MSDYCVVVADATRARFFVLEPSNRPASESSPRLIEQDGLRNSERRARDANGFSDTRTGANRSPGSRTHPYDDHRSRHVEEFDRRFASLVADRIRRLTETHAPRQVIIAAPDRMLGLLRQALNGFDRASIQDVALDLTKQNQHAIHDRLARDALLPRCLPPLRRRT